MPSHFFYVDDLMVYSNDSHSNIYAMNMIFIRYALFSGQMVNVSKSTIYAGSISNDKLHRLVSLAGFNNIFLPFWYLRILIVKGKPKVRHLQPIADKNKSKLASWKALFLSFAGRTQLVKRVVQSMLTHSISLYCWHVSLLRDLQR